MKKQKKIKIYSQIIDHLYFDSSYIKTNVNLTKASEDTYDYMLSTPYYIRWANGFYFYFIEYLYFIFGGELKLLSRARNKDKRARYLKFWQGLPLFFGGVLFKLVFAATAMIVGGQKNLLNNLNYDPKQCPNR